MKLISLLLLFCVAAQTVAYKNFVRKNATDFEQAHQNCEKELKPSPELYAQFVELKFPESEITDCYVGCVMEKLDLYSSAKGFLEKNLMIQLNINDPQLLKEIQSTFEDCQDEAYETDVEKVVANVVKCFMKRHGELVKTAFGF